MIFQISARTSFPCQENRQAEVMTTNYIILKRFILRLYKRQKWRRNQASITSQKYCLLITNDYTSLLLFIHYLQCVVIFYRHGNGVKINAELKFVSLSILFSRQASKER